MARIYTESGINDSIINIKQKILSPPLARALGYSPIYQLQMNKAVYITDVKKTFYVIYSCHVFAFFNVLYFSNVFYKYTNSNKYTSTQ